MTLEKQGDILPRRRQQNHIYDKRPYLGRSGCSTAELPRKSPLSVLKTPKRSSRMSNSEEFAYDGSQAFETGNPDLLDPPFRVNDLRAGKLGSASPKIGSSKSNGNPKSYQPIHLPSIQPIKLQLPRTSQTEGDKRSLFDSMETDDAEDSLAAKIRPKVERRKFKAPGNHCRPEPSPLRPHSATEMTQRPRVKTNKSTKFVDDDEFGVETSTASATAAFRSVTPSIASAISFQLQEKLKASETSPRRRGQKRTEKQVDGRRGEGKQRGKRKSPAKSNSSISITKRTPRQRSTTEKSKREKIIEQPEIKSTPRKSRRTVREDGTQSGNDILLENEGAEPKGGPRKTKTRTRISSLQKATLSLHASESCLSEIEPPHQKNLTKSSSESCIPKPVLEKNEIQKPSPARRNDEACSDVELRSAVSLIFKAVDQVERFIRNPAPKGMTIRCRITRDKHGIEGGLFPSYYLFLEGLEDRRRCFLLSARRKRRAATCTYLISMDAINAPSGEKFAPNTVCSSTEMNAYNFGNGGKVSMGCLRSNFLGTQFVLCREAPDSNRISSGEEWNREIAAIAYEPNLLGFKGPRKMTILLRSETDLESLSSFKELSKYLTGVPASRDDSSGILELHNKKPMWNEETQSYVLNFHGRVTQASVKNFQLVDKKDGTSTMDTVSSWLGATSDVCLRPQ
nr:tubby [Hymenolepis microstoma]